MPPACGRRSARPNARSTCSRNGRATCGHREQGLDATGSGSATPIRDHAALSEDCCELIDAKIDRAGAAYSLIVPATRRTNPRGKEAVRLGGALFIRPGMTIAWPLSSPSRPALTTDAESAAFSIKNLADAPEGLNPATSPNSVAVGPGHSALTIDAVLLHFLVQRLAERQDEGLGREIDRHAGARLEGSGRSDVEDARLTCARSSPAEWHGRARSARRNSSRSSAAAACRPAPRTCR